MPEEEQKHEQLDKYRQLKNEFETVLDMDASDDDIVDEETFDDQKKKWNIYYFNLEGVKKITSENEAEARESYSTLEGVNAKILYHI